MEWLRKLLRDAPKTEDGNLDIDTVVDQINKELPKYTVPKEVYNTIKRERDEASAKLADAQKVDVAALQQQLEDEKAGRAVDKGKYAFLTAATKRGAKDPDYLLYKYGADNIKLDEKGSLDDEEGLFKSLQESYAGQFETDTGVIGTSPNTLTTQTTQPVFTPEQLRGMTVDQINANWGDIQKSL
ncbi:hypothetical protein H8K20_06400 [Neobittarella massiliensis]|uniref:Uncharacterized protein n=1 Tax=Neobittarella massiliensis (ex Bilen et al. 2018) TaxID=2041842 RepID=A0A8J6IM34_9FIRM|nr:hypothetical protein [Neobittarella massiliensis]MBC3516024.1 hypothetical protein [Neobittarella massiliensis]